MVKLVFKQLKIVLVKIKLQPIYRNEWKSVVDDAYNGENDVNAYRRAFATILAWEARLQIFVVKLNSTNNLD